MESCICKVRVILYTVRSTFEIHSIFSSSRLGQEPPPPQQEDSYDGRSLAEVSPVIPVLVSVVFTSCYWSQCRLETRSK